MGRAIAKLYDGGTKEFTVRVYENGDGTRTVLASDPGPGSKPVEVATGRPFTSTVVLGWMMPVVDPEGGAVSVTQAMVAALAPALGMSVEIGGSRFKHEAGT